MVGVLILIRFGLQSDELKARLEKLREIQERKEYAELVRDVAPPSKDDAPEPFSSYKDQIGFGTNPTSLFSNCSMQPVW